MHFYLIFFYLFLSSIAWKQKFEVTDTELLSKFEVGLLYMIIFPCRFRIFRHLRNATLTSLTLSRCVLGCKDDLHACLRSRRLIPEGGPDCSFSLSNLSWTFGLLATRPCNKGRIHRLGSQDRRLKSCPLGACWPFRNSREARTSRGSNPQHKYIMHGFSPPCN